MDSNKRSSTLKDLGNGLKALKTVDRYHQVIVYSLTVYRGSEIVAYKNRSVVGGVGELINRYKRGHGDRVTTYVDYKKGA